MKEFKLLTKSIALLNLAARVQDVIKTLVWDLVKIILLIVSSDITQVRSELNHSTNRSHNYTE
jgi:hypothetical protein